MLLPAAGLSSGVLAADVSAPSKPVAPDWSWTGFYAGAHVGSARILSHYNNPAADRYGPGYYAYGNVVDAAAALIGIQGGYNWQMPKSNWVLGIEADLSLLDSRGSHSCLTADSLIDSANCTTRAHAMGSLAARLGVAVGADNRTLLYSKLGVGLVNSANTETKNYDNFYRYPYGSSSTSVGALLGIGVEYALSNSLSAKLEYAHTFLGSGYTQQTEELLNGNPVSLRGHQAFDAVEFGINYHFGATDAAPWTTPRVAAPNLADSGWEIEAGTRYWYSMGKFQKDLGLSGPAAVEQLVSRLTYSNTGHVGEIFGRIDSPFGVFMKGNIGIGGLTNITMHDEDWLADPLYSNTRHSGSGSIGYATIDLGYDVIHDHDNRLGGFIGYSYLFEKQNAYGCMQMTVNPAICGPGQVTSSTLTITETDRWNSLRLGLSGQFEVFDRLRLGVDAAYLPYVSLSGRDDHWLRTLVIDESGNGQGMQLEASLSYAISREFSVAAGARYWALWVDTGSDLFNGVSTARNVTYRTERAGVFLQASYKFGLPGTSR
ncbi:MAG: outer membrane beta-barrel protein [Ancalomicrobiaceae bacterium]|nr:outer membrane beta-barrel protein [Ancalomicrobiaceae bacterium]